MNMRNLPSPRMSHMAAPSSVAALDRRSGGRRKRAPSPYREWRGFVGSCDQVLVGEAAADSATTALEPLVLVLRVLATADINLVDFYNPSQFGRVVAAGFAKPLKHEPRGFLCHADLRVQLQAADALPRRNEQIHGIEPLVQRHLRPLKDRIRADGEVGQAGVTAVESALADADPLGFATGRAGGPVRPALRFEVEARAFLIGEHLEQFEGGNCGLAHCLARHALDDGTVAFSGFAVLKARKKNTVFAADHRNLTALHTSALGFCVLNGSFVAVERDHLKAIHAETLDREVSRAGVNLNLEHFVSPCLDGPLPPDKPIITRSHLGSQVYKWQLNCEAGVSGHDYSLNYTGLDRIRDERREESRDA